MVTATVTLIRLRAAIGRLGLAAVIAVASQVPAAALAWSQPASCAAATGQHHVALVVQHGDGSTKVGCVAFSGAGLTGEQALASSGIEYQTVSFGGLSKAVCQVDGEPATFPAECWTSTSDFWALFVARAGGRWSASSVGVSSLVLHDGDSEGLRYEPQAQPVAPTVYGDCPLATPTPKPTARPTAKPTSTSQPTETAPPSAAASQPRSPRPTSDAAESSMTGAPADSDSPSVAASASVGSLVQAATGSPDPSSGALAVTTLGSSGDASSGTPIAPVLGLAVIAGLTGLAIARARSNRRGGPP